MAGAFQANAFQNNAFQTQGLPATDFFDCILQFPNQGAFQTDPLISALVPVPFGVPLLVYNPVESLYLPVPLAPFNAPFDGNAISQVTPQLAISSVALPGFWVMISVQGTNSAFNVLSGHPNIVILNDRNLMFAQKPSVVFTIIDVSHINIVINIFGVYVTDGLQLITPVAPTLSDLLLEDDVSGLLLEDGVSNVLLEG